MRLLLDEMYPPAIAAGLRANRDVVAVQEEETLGGLTDQDLFAEAQRLRRALVTENVVDLLPLAIETTARGQAHHGLILTTNNSFPRHGRRFVGRLVRALDDFLADHQEDEMLGVVHWL